MISCLGFKQKKSAKKASMSLALESCDKGEPCSMRSQSVSKRLLSRAGRSSRFSGEASLGAFASSGMSSARSTRTRSEVKQTSAAQRSGCRIFAWRHLVPSAPLLLTANATASIHPRLGSAGLGWVLLLLEDAPPDHPDTPHSRPRLPDAYSNSSHSSSLDLIPVDGPSVALPPPSTKPPLHTYTTVTATRDPLLHPRRDASTVFEP